MTTLEVVVPLPRAQHGLAARVVLQVWDEQTLPARYSWMMFGERAPWLQEHLWITRELYLLRLSFWLAKWVGWISVPVLLVKAPALLLALNTNPFVLASTAHKMPIPLFFVISIARMMLPDPVNYFIGQRTAETGSDLPIVGTRPSGRLKRCLSWLYGLAYNLVPAAVKTRLRCFAAWLWRFIRRRMLVAVFVLTLLPPPGVPMGPNIYTAAGVARARLVWVLAMSLAARLIWATGFYMLGSVFNLLNFVERLF